MRKLILILTLIFISSINSTFAISTNKFLDICEKGTIEQFEKILNSGFNLNKTDKEGFTALMLASNNKNSNILKILISTKPNLDAKNKFGETALIRAVYNKNLEAINLLLSAGADVNTADNKQITPLILAAFQNDNPQIVQRLLFYGANINAKDINNYTSLMYAAEANNKKLDIAKLLLSNCADINFSNPEGTTALLLAVNNKNIELVKLLLTFGANVNAKLKNNVTALIGATFEQNSADIIKILLDAGANISVKNTDNKTAYDYAKKQEKILPKELLNRLEKTTNFTGLTSNTSNFGILCKNAFPWQIEANIKAGADINRFYTVPIDQNNFQLTPLMSAAYNPNPFITKLLIENKANISMKDEDGNTALVFAAAFNENPLVIKELLAAGANPNTLIRGASILMYAAIYNTNPIALEILLNAGADPKIKDETGRTAYDYAKLKNLNMPVRLINKLKI